MAKILFVDDDAALLELIRRGLGGEFDIHVSKDPVAALGLLRPDAGFDVVVSDLHMPELSGLEVLKEALAAVPNVVRIMLTGKGDLKAASDAVNEAQVFRFLTKPFTLPALAVVLQAAARQAELLRAERELVEGTLRGAVRLITEVVELFNPSGYGRASRISRLAVRLATALGLPDVWQVEVAGLMSQVGPTAVLVETALHPRPYREGPDEVTWKTQASNVAFKLISNIPRLRPVAEIVAFQYKGADGSGPPEMADGAVPLPSRILRAATDYEQHLEAGRSPPEAIRALTLAGGVYDADVLAALGTIVQEETTRRARDVTLGELAEGMVLAEDIVLASGTPLLTKGQQMTLPLLERVKRIAERTAVREPLKVFGG